MAVTAAAAPPPSPPAAEWSSPPALSLYANYDSALRTGNTADQTLSAGLVGGFEPGQGRFARRTANFICGGLGDQPNL